MRIVSLSPSLTEVLLQLDLGTDLIGTTDPCPQISAACQRLGPAKALHLEKIQSLKPDVIVTAFTENRPEEIRELEKCFRISSFKVISVPALIKTIAELGDLFERMQQAKNFIRKIYEAWPVPSKNPRRALILLWNAPFLTVNGQTYASSLIEAAGGLNVFREEPVAEVPIELEDMADSKPEFIFLPSKPFPFDEAQADFFRKVPVFSNAQVCLVDGSFFSDFGSKTIAALRELKTIFQGKPHDTAAR